MLFFFTFGPRRLSLLSDVRTYKVDQSAVDINYEVYAFLSQKAINDVTEISLILKVVNAIVGWFHHSTLELRKVSTKTEIQDVLAKWNFTYNMITRFLELRSFINEIINRNTTALSMLTVTEMEDLQE